MWIGVKRRRLVLLLLLHQLSNHMMRNAFVICMNTATVYVVFSVHITKDTIFNVWGFKAVITLLNV